MSITGILQNHHGRHSLVRFGSPLAQPTLLCADITGFTPMVERLGDLRSLDVMRRVTRIVRKKTRAQGGTQLELHGDCFLLSFDSPLAAIHCAVAIQRAVTADRAAHPGEGVQFRIAIHTGAVIRNRHGFFGRNVIVPFRLLERTAGGQILISSQAKRLVGGGFHGHFTAERTFKPKGFRDEIGFVSVEWLGELATSTTPPLLALADLSTA